MIQVRISSEMILGLAAQKSELQGSWSRSYGMFYQKSDFGRGDPQNPNRTTWEWFRAPNGVYRGIQNTLQTDICFEGNQFQWQIVLGNRADRRVHFHYTKQVCAMLAENLSLQIPILPWTPFKALHYSIETNFFFRGWHRGLKIVTSFLRFSGPFFMQQNELQMQTSGPKQMNSVTIPATMVGASTENPP